MLQTQVGTYGCGNTQAPELCTFEQQDASSPVVDSLTLTTAEQVTVTGSNFPTSDYEAVIIISGVESSSSTINSSSEIIATFDNGVPIATDATPSIRFVPSSAEEGRRRRLISIDGILD